MWLWRDRTLDQDIDQQQVLREALKANNMADVAELVWVRRDFRSVMYESIVALEFGCVFNFLGSFTQMSLQ